MTGDTGTLTVVPMARPRPLSVDKLYRTCDPHRFRFNSTAELREVSGVLGQERAVEAIEFGINIQRPGYNLFAMGPSGSGKHTIIRSFLDAKAAESDGDGVCDWCYVNNFENDYAPTVLRLPRGKGRQLASDMEQLTSDLVAAIPTMFESDEYRAQLREIEDEFSSQEDEPFRKMQKRAEKKGIAILRTPSGLAMSPMKNGKVIEPEVFEKLSEAEKHRLTEAVQEVQKDLQEFVQQAPKWRRELQKRVRELNREIIRNLVSSTVGDLRKSWSREDQVTQYLDAVEKDVVDNAEVFRQPGSDQQGAESPTIPVALLPQQESVSGTVARYRINVLIDNRNTEGRPVVYEDNPSYENLVGAIEHVADMGALITDFTLIKPGALHRANGGFLIIEARELLQNPYAWEVLKRALLSNQIRTEPLGKRLSMLSTITLEPEAVPLDVKVVLVGDRRLYYLLQRHDPDFAELFKVMADFEERIPRDRRNLTLYARTIATIAKREGLLPFNRTGVARLIEHSSRLAGDAERLSVHMLGVVDLAREADFHARSESKKLITSVHLDKALDAQIRRASRLPERMRESIQRGTILIDTKGEQVGQINALSVYQLGGFGFGQPNRVTARVRQGAGRVIDIEREVSLGGSLHSKGVLILTGYLNATFLPTQTLSLAASLVFEQSYGKVDGDSASSTELYALLSALSEAPIKQSFAVTGSVNQFGQVQAIGGVNEKIEGFFDVCAERGLTGDQGVLIPVSNVKHLMLKKDVRDSVKAKTFSIYPIKTIDQGIEILTDVPAGRRGKNGHFPEKSINGRAEMRLAEFALAKKGDASNNNNSSSSNGTNGKQEDKS